MKPPLPGCPRGRVRQGRSSGVPPRDGRVAACLRFGLFTQVLLLTACSIGLGPGAASTAAPRPTLLPSADSGLPSGLRLPLERADAAAAERSFARDCVPCHGPTGRGDGPRAPLLRPGPADLQDEGRQRGLALSWQHRSIAEGKGAMPAWGLQYDERRIWDLAFLTWSMALGPRSGDQEAYASHCAGCHGAEPGTEAQGGGHRLDRAGRAARSFDEELALLRQGAHPRLGGTAEATLEAALRWSWTWLYAPAPAATAAQEGP